MDFARHIAEANAVTSLIAARAWLNKSFENAIQFFSTRNEAELSTPLPEGPVMGGAPIASVAGAIVEHTAHHRGALTVYSRLLGKVPPMPYGD